MKISGRDHIKSIRVIVFLSFWGVAFAAHAQVSKVSVAIDGMSCPFCVFGVEKRLKKVDGVAAVTADLKSGIAILTAMEGKTIRPEQVPDAVKAAGFTPGTIQIVVDGKIKIDDRQRFVVRVKDAQQSFLLVNLQAKTKKRLDILVADDTLVKISGKYHAHSDEIAAITPDGIEEVAE